MRELSLWRARVPISICGPTARMERSGPLAGVSRRPSAVPDIDPQAGGQRHPLVASQMLGLLLEDAPRSMDRWHIPCRAGSGPADYPSRVGRGATEIGRAH